MAERPAHLQRATIDRALLLAALCGFAACDGVLRRGSATEGGTPDAAVSGDPGRTPDGGAAAEGGGSNDAGSVAEAGLTSDGGPASDARRVGDARRGADRGLKDSGAARDGKAPGLDAQRRDAGATPPTGLNWYPGYYVLAATREPKGKQKILDDPLVAPFHGVQFRYDWAESELSPGNYSAGFAALDDDLARVAAKGKKLLVMLMYKKFDGSSAVPADLRAGPGAHCNGSVCGEMVIGSTRYALLWNAAVEARLKAWVFAMASHLTKSPYLSSVAGVIFNETSSTKDVGILTAAGFDPYRHLQAVQENLLAVTAAAPRLAAFIYFEGGFMSMDGNPVKAPERMGDWMLLHPRTGVGRSDMQPKNPDANHPCANPTYQGRVPCAPAVEAIDYARSVTDSLQQSFSFGLSPAPNGLYASFITFSYRDSTSAGDAFSFADVSKGIASHPIVNSKPPSWW
ncbi:MAG: hypothetical protein IT371_08315 [Deltaproteobacteria bacterium]|nr:hypothetical protein [Deltaproteobacteria bacterium]